VRGVGEIDAYFVRASRETNHNDGFATGIDEVPGQIIDGDVHVSNARRDLKRACAKDGYDADILGPVLDENETA
jgi:hypothetical protein